MTDDKNNITSKYTSPAARRRRLILALLLFLAAVAVAVGIVALLVRRPPRPVSLVLSYTLSPADDTALRQALARFSSLYPHIQVSALNADPLDPGVADLLAAPAHLFPALAAGSERSDRLIPLPWSGPVWTLAARKEALERASKALPAEVIALRSGGLDPDGFRRLLRWFAAAGTPPITLGNSHRWPYLLWLQHWAAATGGPALVSALPAPAQTSAGADPGTAPADPYAALRPAMAELGLWRSEGLFNQKVWGEGWARGLLPLARGEAVFALVSAEYLEPIPANRRAELEFLPFPRRPGDGPWSIGSATFLGILPRCTAPEEAATLLRFLTSPGVTEDLTRATGKPFFAWDAKSGAYPQVLPAWLEAAATPAFDALARAALGK